MTTICGLSNEAFAALNNDEKCDGIKTKMNANASQINELKQQIAKLDGENEQLNEEMSKIKQLNKEISKINPSCWQRIKTYLTSDSVKENLMYFGLFCLTILAIVAFGFLTLVLPAIV